MLVTVISIVLVCNTERNGINKVKNMTFLALDFQKIGFLNIYSKFQDH